MRWGRWFLDRPREPAFRAARALTWLLLLAGFSLLCWAVLFSTTRNWAAVWEYREVFLKGWLLTVGLSAAALVSSVVIGVAAALARRSGILALRSGATLYIECVRGMPLLVLIFVLFYGLPQITRHGDRFFFGVLALSLFAGAYIAEMVRAGIESVGASQRESARAIGLTTAQTYLYIIYPQALRNILPPLAGQFASLIKDSSLLSVIGLVEFTRAAQQVNSQTFSTMESFLPLAVGYLVLTLPISLWAKRLEARLHYET